MTTFEVLQSITDITLYSELVHDLIHDNQTEEEVKVSLQRELTEEHLQTVVSAAKKMGYPLSFSRKQ